MYVWSKIERQIDLGGVKAEIGIEDIDTVVQQNRLR